MKPLAHDFLRGDNSGRILLKFRQFAKSYVGEFISARDRIFNLLGGSQNYASGTFREEIVRMFLGGILPASISIDSGFIYGFEIVPTSAQLDIIIWDSAHYAPVFKTGNLVIVAPESVIAVISIKSTLNKRDIIEGLKNLGTIPELEWSFRGIGNQNAELQFYPIYKFLLAMRGPAKPQTPIKTISEYYTKKLTKKSPHIEALMLGLQQINPVMVQPYVRNLLTWQFPRMITVLDEPGMGLQLGYGPPDDSFMQKTYGPDFKRIPYLYEQEVKVTTALEKFAFEVQSAVYQHLGTSGRSQISAWIDMNPLIGGRVGDAYEINEANGKALIDPEKFR